MLVWHFQHVTPTLIFWIPIKADFGLLVRLRMLRAKSADGFYEKEVINMTRRIYLIDGVAVTKKIWDRRQIFGEYLGASFAFEDVAIETERD